MRRILCIALSMVAAASFASTNSLRSMIESMNNKVTNALIHKDMATFEKITRAGVTSDFKYSEQGHESDYNGMLSMMKQSFAMMKKVNVARATTTSFAQHKDTATASTRHHMVATVNGPDKKSHKMVMDGVSNDTYRKEGGKWKLAVMAWHDSKMTMDGKPFDPSKMMPPSSGGK